MQLIPYCQCRHRLSGQSMPAVTMLNTEKGKSFADARDAGIVPARSLCRRCPMPPLYNRGHGLGIGHGWAWASCMTPGGGPCPDRASTSSELPQSLSRSPRPVVRPDPLGRVPTSSSDEEQPARRCPTVPPFLFLAEGGFPAQAPVDTTHKKSPREPNMNASTFFEVARRQFHRHAPPRVRAEAPIPQRTIKTYGSFNRASGIRTGLDTAHRCRPGAMGGAP
jgi:hypothetical protein